MLCNEFFGPRIRMRRHPGIEQTFEEPRYQCGAGYAQITGSFIYGGVQASPGFRVETDVGPIGGKRGDPATPLTQFVEVEGSRTQ
jgi:hypothetical protein